MIAGIGLDLVLVSRMDKILQGDTADRFVARVLHANEQTDFSKNLNPANYLAKRFAAKEAAVKALGTGFRNGIRMDEIEVYNDTLGKPHLRLHGAAKLEFDQIANKIHISITDDGDYAAAYVVTEQI